MVIGPDTTLTHGWDIAPADAVSLQKRLAPLVRLEPFRRRSFLLAGTDVSFDDDAGMAVAGVVVVKIPSMETVEERFAFHRLEFPYIPGLLSFREVPALLAAFALLRIQPDCVMADGHGLAHPRRFGLACHLGLLMGIPAFGCAKSRLTGRFIEPGGAKGSRSPLLIGDETVGAVVRTRRDVSPVFVSAGHLIDLAGAVRATLSASITRIPEPTRRAHALVTRVACCNGLGHNPPP
jgi:deoxyribonuclease V